MSWMSSAQLYSAVEWHWARLSDQVVSLCLQIRTMSGVVERVVGLLQSVSHRSNEGVPAGPSVLAVRGSPTPPMRLRAMVMGLPSHPSCTLARSPQIRFCFMAPGQKCWQYMVCQTQVHTSLKFKGSCPDQFTICVTRFLSASIFGLLARRLLTV